MLLRKLLWLTLLAPCSLLAAGCGSNSVGDLTGEISLNGSAVKAAQITAYNEKGEVLGRTMALDGKYQLTGIPLGPVTLAVETHQPGGAPVTTPTPPLGPGQRPQPANTKKEESTLNLPTSLDPVPLKYTNPKQSGLQITVAKGTTDFNIAMTGKGEIPKLQVPTGAMPVGGPPGFPPGGGPPGFQPGPGGGGLPGGPPGLPPGVPPPPRKP